MIPRATTEQNAIFPRIMGLLSHDAGARDTHAVSSRTDISPRSPACSHCRHISILLHTVYNIYSSSQRYYDGCEMRAARDPVQRTKPALQEDGKIICHRRRSPPRHRVIFRARVRKRRAPRACAVTNVNRISGTGRDLKRSSRLRSDDAY